MSLKMLLWAVPAAGIPGNASGAGVSVSTSAPAASAQAIRLDAAGYTRVVVGGIATANFRIDSDGGVYGQSGASVVKQYDWIIPNGDVSGFECRWVSTGQTPTTTPGSSGTWLACTSDRSWAHTANNNDDTVSFTCELRRTGGATLFSVTITLNALGSP